MSKTITESQFYMWRTLFAISHADNVVSDEEIRFMTEALEDLPFSEEQKEVLRDDIVHQQDIVEMFGKISNNRDQAAFFNFARELVWVDGDYGKEEQDIMLKLKRLHIENVDVDDLIGNVGLQLEADENDRNFSGSGASSSADGKNVKNIVYSFRERFLKDKRGK